MKLEQQLGSRYMIPGSKPHLKGQPELEMLNATIRDLTAEAGVDSSASTPEQPLNQDQLELIMQQRILWFGHHLKQVRTNPSGEGAWGLAA